MDCPGYLCVNLHIYRFPAFFPLNQFCGKRMENGSCLKPWYSWREKCALSAHQWAVVVTLILYDYFWQEGGICSPIKTLVGGSAFPLKVRIRHWDKTDLIKYLCWENERTWISPNDSQSSASCANSAAIFLVFIMENEGPSHRPRLGCETYHPQGARPVLVAQWGWLLGWPLKKWQKGHLCHQVLLQKPSSLALILDCL